MPRNKTLKMHLRVQDNIKMFLEEIFSEDIDCIMIRDGAK
jgi:hypothetical protein